MPDIFDQLAPAAAPAHGDVFDQISAGGRGDIFDTLDAGPSANAPTAENVAAYNARQARANSVGHLQDVSRSGPNPGTLNPEQQAQQAEQNAEMMRQGLSQAGHPILANVLSAGMAGQQSLNAGSERVAEALGFNRPQYFEESQRAASPNVGGAPGAAGDISGQVAPMMAAGPLGPFAPVMEGAGALKSKWLAEKAAGQNPTGKEVAADTAKTYAQTALPFLLPGATLLKKSVPEGVQAAELTESKLAEQATKDAGEAAARQANKPRLLQRLAPEQPEQAPAPLRTAEDQATVQRRLTPDRQSPLPGNEPLSVAERKLLPDRFQAPTESAPPRVYPNDRPQSPAASEPAVTSPAPEAAPLKTPNRLQAIGMANRLVNAIRGRYGLDTSRINSEIDPLHEVTKNMSQADRDAWIDSMNKTGKSTIPALKPAEEMQTRFNKEYIDRLTAANERSAKLGLKPVDMSDFKTTHMGFSSKGPKSNVAGVRDNGPQGAEGYLNPQTSPDVATYRKNVAALGRTTIDDPIDMWQNSNAQVLKSIGARETFLNQFEQGFAAHLPEDGQVPPGWRIVGGLGDKLTNPEQRPIIMPNQLASVWEKFYGAEPDTIADAVRQGRFAKFATDLYTLGRGAKGAIGAAANDALRGNVGTLKNLKTAYKVVQQPELLNEPEYARAKAALETGSKSGLNVFDPKVMRDAQQSAGAATWDALKRGGRIVTSSLQQHTIRPMKAAFVMNAVKIAEENPNLAAADRKAFVDTAVDVGNRFFGGNFAPNLNRVVKTLFPYVEYRTSGVRTIAAAANDIAHGKVASQNVTGAVGALVASAVTAEALRQLYGTSIESVRDILEPRTGQKNPDGSDVRVQVPGQDTALINALELARHGELTDTAWQITGLDRSLGGLANAYTGFDTAGRKMSASERAKAAVSPFVPMTPPQSTATTTHQPWWQTMGGMVREEPAGAEHSAAYNAALNAMPSGGGTEEQATARKAVLDAIRNGDDLTPFKESGEITPENYQRLKKEASTVFDLKAVVSRLAPADILTVWNKATPDERKQIAPGIWHRINNAASRKPWRQLEMEMETTHG